MSKLLEFIKEGLEVGGVFFVLMLLGIVQVGYIVWWLIRMVF